MSENLAPLLTPSQEMQILLDQDVGNIMTLFDGESQEVDVKDFMFQQQQLMFDQTLSNSEEQQHNGLEQYSVMPDVLPRQVQLPIQPSLISNEEYAGPFNFEVMVDPHYGSKNPWVTKLQKMQYSAVLNKIFISISNRFPVDFKWNGNLKNLFVRATPLYSLAQHAQDLVTRCIPHSLEYDVSNRNVPKNILDHIVRCESPGALYLGSKDEKVHLNVIVPLGTPQTGTDSVRVMYSFVCKNSCPTGMNRKPFEVVFTLEDDVGRVLGRRKLSVRVCSCPKRDKEKEEKDFLKEGGASSAPPPGKKKKTDKKPPSFNGAPLDTREYTVTMRVCGKQNRDMVLKTTYGLMAADLSLHGHNETVKKCMDDIQAQMKNQD